MFALISTYLFFLLILFVFQRHLIYFPEHWSLSELQHVTKNSNLSFWPSKKDYRGLISVDDKPAQKGTVIVFHGNAGSAINRTGYVKALQHIGYRVILNEYPGYGARDGQISEYYWIKDGLETVQTARTEFGGPIFLWGESLGCGVVSGIIASRNVDVAGIVLITPFDSLPKVAGHHYWFFLARYLTKDKYNNIKNLKNYKGKSAVIVAQKDEIIPNKYSYALYHSLSGRKKMWEFKDSGHNSIPFDPNLSWWRDVMQFVDVQTSEYH